MSGSVTQTLPPKQESSQSQDPDPQWRINLKEAVERDINGPRNEYYFRSPEFLTQLLGISDRDRPLWYCLFNAGVLNLLQLSLLPFLYNYHWIFVAIPPILRSGFMGLPRYVLALHFSAHVPCIKPIWLNKLYVEWLLTPLYGLPPATYYFHHVIMHHREDNIMPRDLSSTMPYQRDNFWQFLHYWARFEFAIWFELPYYLWTAGWKFYAFLVVAGSTFWWFANYVLWCIRPAFMLWTLFIPQVVLSMFLMFGNFSQHIFIDEDDYTNDHLLTVNLIDTDYNAMTFNDGYHIVHHKYPILHWSLIPQRFLTEPELQSHAKAHAICLRGLDYFWLGLYVMTGQLRKIAVKHFLPCNETQAKMTVDEIVEFLKGKLRPVQKKKQRKN
jgi:fatty acid desaturase